MRKYSAEGARWLAKEFARRGTFFCAQFYKAGGHGMFRHTEDSNSLYQEGIDFLDWAIALDVEGPCFAAVMELRRTVPEV